MSDERKAYWIDPQAAPEDAAVRWITDDEAIEHAAAGCKVERTECFDQYREIGFVTAAAYYENGWAMECDTCGREFDQFGPDDDLDEDETEEGPSLSPQFSGSLAWCSLECRWAHDERKGGAT